MFAIEAFGTRVAQVRLSEGGPRLLARAAISRARRPSLLHRVDDLDATVARLREHGAEIEAEFGFPHGPAAELRYPGGQQLAFYELTRPKPTSGSRTHGLRAGAPQAS